VCVSVGAGETTAGANAGAASSAWAGEMNQVIEDPRS
jgi:hypothetical protein